MRYFQRDLRPKWEHQMPCFSWVHAVAYDKVIVWPKDNLYGANCEVGRHLTTWTAMLCLAATGSCSSTVNNPGIVWVRRLPGHERNEILVVLTRVFGMALAKYIQSDSFHLFRSENTSVNIQNTCPSLSALVRGCRCLIWYPKSTDPQVHKLLAGRGPMLRTAETSPQF